MTGAFARFGGGLIARHYPQPWDIRLSELADLMRWLYSPPSRSAVLGLDAGGR